MVIYSTRTVHHIAKDASDSMTLTSSSMCSKTRIIILFMIVLGDKNQCLAPWLGHMHKTGSHVTLQELLHKVYNAFDTLFPLCTMNSCHNVLAIVFI